MGSITTYDRKSLGDAYKEGKETSENVEELETQKNCDIVSSVQS
jgi:hypothetical protein